MSGVFFRELGIPEPAANLAIGSGPHGAQTGAMLAKIEELLLADRPDAVLVYGDTNSTLAGALAAVKLHIPVAHVEAGLRSRDLKMPEEVNRVLTDAISQVLFAPTEEAAANLTREGRPPDSVLVVGDVMYDAAMRFAATAGRISTALDDFSVEPRRFVLATIHRASNTDDPEKLRSIVAGLIALAADIPVLWPLHPRTRGALGKCGLLDEASRALKLVEPVGYLDMIHLERYAAVICTDSGGVQREAFYYGVPCVTLRDETEWTETVACGANVLVGTDGEQMRAAVQDWLDRPRAIPDAGPYYGEGQASIRIAETMAAMGGV